MIKDLWNQLTHFLVPENSFSQLDSTKRIAKISSIRTMAGLAIFVFFFTISLCTISLILSKGATFKSMWTMILMAFLYLGFSLFARRLPSTLVTPLFFLPMMIIIPLRSLKFGGIYAPHIMFLVLIPFFVGVSSHFKVALSSSLFLIFECLLVTNFTLENKQEILQRLSSETVIILVFFSIIALHSTVLWFVYSLNTERENAQKKLNKEQEKLYSTSRLVAMGSMAGGIAHEVNTPLAVILARLSLLERREHHPDSDKDIQKIKEVIQRIQKISYGLVNFSQSKTDEEISQVSFSQVILDTLILIDQRCLKLGINIIKEVELDDDLIFCQEKSLAQSLYGLIDNSIHAITQDEAPWIQLKLSKEGAYIKLSITDSGSIRDPNIIEHLFDPFYTAKPIGEGAGLGLSSARGIIERSKGSLHFDKGKKNTTFHIQMPQKEYFST